MIRGETSKLQETINQIAVDCIELIEANDEADASMMKGYCRLYLPFAERRYKALHSIRRDTISYYGLQIRPYYNGLMKEVEETMGILLREDTLLLREQLSVLLSFCWELHERLFPSKEVLFEREWMEEKEMRKKRVTVQIEKMFLNGYKVSPSTYPQRENVKYISKHR